MCSNGHKGACKKAKTVQHLCDRQPLVLYALDGCWLEGAITHIWPKHQVGIGSNDPSLHSSSNDRPHPRDTKGFIDDELSIFLYLVMPVHTHT